MIFHYSRCDGNSNRFHIRREFQEWQLTRLLRGFQCQILQKCSRGPEIYNSLKVLLSIFVQQIWPKMKKVLKSYLYKIFYDFVRGTHWEAPKLHSNLHNLASLYHQNPVSTTGLVVSSFFTLKQLWLWGTVEEFTYGILNCNIHHLTSNPILKWFLLQSRLLLLDLWLYL